MKSVMKKILVIGLALGLAGTAAVAVVLISLSSSLPQIITVDDYEPLLVSEVYSRSGEKIGEFFREKRILVPHEQIPEQLIQAFVSAEDSNFYEHYGINFLAIVRAMWANIKAGRRAQGASTITQQVARSLLLSPEKTYIRKLREMILAYRMESHLSKNDIIYLYLNQIYFGQGAYGIGMAAETYFRKQLNQLTLPEMAILAGLPQAPSRYSPVYNPKKAKERQKYVLRRMAIEGYVTNEVAQAAIQEPVTVYVRQNFKDLAPYYLETVRQLLVSEIGEKAVLDQGLQIYTGLDLEKQKSAQKSLREGLRALDKRQGYRGPIKNLQDPVDIAKFLLETRNDLISKKSPERIILPDGTNPPIPELELAEIPENQIELEGEEKAERKPNLPDYVKAGDIVEGLVIDVDDEWGLVRVRFAEALGLIELDTMKWARVPNPEVRYDFDEIKRPSLALKKGDVIQVRVMSKRFYSHEINKRLNEMKRKKKDKYERPEELPEFGKWAELELEQEPIAEAALISFDQETQEILAMSGGYDFKRSQFNRVLQATRQTGSAFKAIVYASALDRGYTAATPITDSPIVYEEEVEEEGQIEGEAETEIRRWKPTNHSKRFRGDILFRNALIKSLNIPAVKVIQDVGVDWVADYAKRMGIFSPLNMDYTLALGSSGVTLYEITKVFSTFGRLGHRIRPLLIHQVLTRKGEVLLEKMDLDHRFRKEIQAYEETFEERRQAYLKIKELADQEKAISEEELKVAQESLLTEGTEEEIAERKKELAEIAAFKKTPPLFFDNSNQLMSPQTAYLITSILEGTVHERGTGIAARALGRRVAAKTGTTNGYYDGWFIGYTPQISTGVWVGFDQERSLGRSEVGGRNALPIWLEYMKVAHDGLPERTFPVPSDIIFANIDNETGKLASAVTKNYVRQAFLDGTEPREISTAEEAEEETDFLKEDLSE